MDFSFPKEYQLLRRTIREFAQNEIAPIAKKIDEEEEIPRELIDKMAKLGFLGVYFPQKYSGMGGGEMGYCILMEEMDRVCGSTATFLGTHIGIGAMAIYVDGNEEQKKKYLTPLARGEKIAAFGLTESGAGSDAAAIQTRAEMAAWEALIDWLEDVEDWSIVQAALPRLRMGPEKAGMLRWEDVEAEWGDDEAV